MRAALPNNPQPTTHKRLPSLPHPPVCAVLGAQVALGRQHECDVTLFVGLVHTALGE